MVTGIRQTDGSSIQREWRFHRLDLGWYDRAHHRQIRKMTAQSRGQRQRHSTSSISNLWSNRGFFHIIASTKDRLSRHWREIPLTSSLQNLLANSNQGIPIRTKVWNERLFFSRYSYSTLKLFIMVSGRHLLVGDHRRQEWHSRKASSCHTPSQQLSTQAYDVSVWIEAKNEKIIRGVDWPFVNVTTDDL